MSDGMSPQEIGDTIGDDIMAAVHESQENSARSLQSQQRILGMSEMGGCREYIRASIAGDKKTPPTKIKWEAFIGTAVGDMMEQVLVERRGAITQEKVTLTLPRTGIQVSGSADLRLPKMVVDLKSVDGLATRRREGPSFKQKAQISGYLIAYVQAGLLEDDATGHLVFYDRSGKTKTTYVWTVTVEQAYLILDAVEDRLLEVQHALDTGQRCPRDEPESYCWHIQCPFYDACWGGHLPTEKIDNPAHIKALERYVAGRDMAKEAVELKESAKQELKGVVGRTDTLILDWKVKAYASGTGEFSETIDVREIPNVTDESSENAAV